MKSRKFQESEDPLSSTSLFKSFKHYEQRKNVKVICHQGCAVVFSLKAGASNKIFSMTARILLVTRLKFLRTFVSLLFFFLDVMPAVAFCGMQVLLKEDSACFISRMQVI